MRTSFVAVEGRKLIRGVLAGVVGTASMDLLLYARYRHGGGTDSIWKWEFAETVKEWDQASAPGQVGRKLEELIAHHPVPDSWARSTTNLVHWATGVGWAVQYALVPKKVARHRLALALALGPAAWLSSYVVLPLVHVYKPIWDYDARTLGDDLSAHLVYGATTAIAYAALCRGS
jgi:hypothetical protein